MGSQLPLTPIPLVDLKAQYYRYQEEFTEAVETCIQNTSFVGGVDHKAFSQEFAQFCGDGAVALCGNGTDALYLSIRELVGQGNGTEEIITVAHTFIATAEAVTLAGYRPVFVDIDPETYLMDIDAVAQAITPHTRAVLPVHLYGQMVEMDRLMAIAQAHNLRVIEDAAQAHGATWQALDSGEMQLVLVSIREKTWEHGEIAARFLPKIQS